VVRDLIGEIGRLRDENAKLGGALTKLKAEHQAVKDELARLKPSGMDQATDRGVLGKQRQQGRRGREAASL
jgi:hypothetical protein